MDKGLKTIEPIVQLKGVQKSYRLGQTMVTALRGIDLKINKGEFTAVVGASGSGKSTLLNMIGCIDQPDSGSIQFDSVEVTKLADDDLSRLRNRKIGFIFQSFNLIPVLSVEENVELPLLINSDINPAQRAERVANAIADVGLESLKRNLPDQLSGGQRQRVAIARALAGNPDLVLADEPTANLDSTNSHKIIDLMLELNARRKVTFLFSTHDEALMGRVSRLVHIQDGVMKL
ncbi:MAG: ABC transporter ATP-binding protein [Proteobacteria bacterium]|jgi:putative ABC transport system ATP-binding protein|nr:ABC transporter ATP-binding protein [Pseudomonadota bacterium]